MSSSAAMSAHLPSTISPTKRTSSKNQQSRGQYTSSQPELNPPEHRSYPPRAMSEQTIHTIPIINAAQYELTPTRQHRDTEDAEDPHDLSISRHVPRASMVDKMVLSLDKFSVTNQTPPSQKSRYHPPNSYLTLRKRGHTFSSSMSSEVDLRDSPTGQLSLHTGPRTLRRNSARVVASSQTLPNILGDEESLLRTKPGEVHSSHQSHSSRGQSGIKTNSSSNSSIDLGHLAGLKLGAAGNRRSQSFDYGVQKRLTHMFVTTERPDTTATTTEFNSQRDHTASIYAEKSVMRPSSTLSARETQSRAYKSSVLGDINTGSREPEDSTSGPALELHHGSIGHASVQKAAVKPLPEPTPALRPGFFRRVFGSSKQPVSIVDSNPHQLTSTTHSAHDYTTPERESSNRPSTPPPRIAKPVQRSVNETNSNREGHQPVKKASTFFRRRKRSVPTNNPPQLPPAFIPERKPDGELQGEASPVSSLRAFMDPYLAGSPVGHSRQRSLHGLAAQIPVLNPSFGNIQTTHLSSSTTTKSVSVPISSTSSDPEKAMITSYPSHSIPQDTGDDLLEPTRSPTLDSTVVTAQANNNSTIRIVDDSGQISPPVTTPALPVSPSLKPEIPLRHGSRRTLISQTSLTDINPNDKMADSPVLDALSVAQQLSVDDTRKDSKVSPRASASDISVYKSAPSTPCVPDQPDHEPQRFPIVHVSHPSMSGADWSTDTQRAKQIYDNGEQDVDSIGAAAWLGEVGTERERVRTAYMNLFDFAKSNILTSLRILCGRLTLKGETQQVDRLLDSFARRWCDCNPNHGFKSSDIVHTICYSILLLNTDLHLADIGQKMTKVQFIRNTMTTLRRILRDQQQDQTLRATTPLVGPTPATSDEGVNSPTPENDTADALGTRKGSDRMTREASADVEAVEVSPLVESPYYGPPRGLENQIEIVLKSFYTSISQQPLPLYGTDVESNLAPTITQMSSRPHSLRRSPSSLSHTYSDTQRKRSGWDSRSLGARWMAKTRSRPRLLGAGDYGSSKTSLEEQSSFWSPSASSTWSKASLGKTLNSMSVDSFGTETTYGDFQSSIGFANALSQAIIRDEQLDGHNEDSIRAAASIEDESLELCGAPWGKEGILKHKCHLDGVDKKSKDRQWNDTFAVIERGWMRLFSFANPTKSVRNNKKSLKPGAVVGGGNWQDNAEEVWKFMLRHTIASALPPPGYSKTRPFVWALSLPTGAVHLFSAGTPDIVKEFVTTANYWSARLSKEPMMGAVSSMEYGWSDAVINRALVPSETQASFVGTTSPRPSTQLSLRSSIDQSSSMRFRSVADRVNIHEWTPPQQTMLPSQLLEVDQLKALLSYVKSNEDELQKHNELRGPMLLAFSSRHPNSARAMTNWEKKSSHLLREIVKFRTYIDALQSARAAKGKVSKMRREEEEAKRALEADHV